MEMHTRTTATSPHLIGQEHLRDRWAWFLALGVLLIVLGVAAVGYSVAATIVSVELFGGLLMLGGLFQTVHAFMSKRWGGFFIDLLTGILYGVVGVMIVANPGASALALTLAIALFLIVGGIFRIVVAIGIRFQHAGWLLLSGVINLILGILIWQQWPVSGLWVIGLFVGIDMLFNGWSLVMLGLAAKRQPAVALGV
jgi:uncharacterized membrane protein HdeD (DUF308 family)